MTLPEIELICQHNPDGKKPKGMTMLDPTVAEMAAVAQVKEYLGLPPGEKLAKRLRERNG